MTIMAAALVTTAVPAAATPTAWPPEGTMCAHGPCAPGNQQCVNPGSTVDYTFHLDDAYCDINDPNGPFYDQTHGVYHLFYQIHLAEPNPVGLKAGAGPDWGHWVSRDFTHWAPMPVAIWNTEYYDNAAIFSGSTTVVDGRPVIVYPGKYTSTSGHGFTYDVALPADLTGDPLLTNWTKPAYNPIMNGTGDDPSTAWRTNDGEWRFIGNQACTNDDGSAGGAPIYASKDFVSWYKVGCTTLLLGDCPTFFPLPKLAPGTSGGLSAAAKAALPNYVHKAGSPNDQVQLGTWTDGVPASDGKSGTPGTWVQLGASVPLDNGSTHASKDFYDPVKDRHVMWVWATVTNGAQTVPREMTYDPRCNRVLFNPVEEIAALRSAQPLDSVPQTTISGTTSAAITASAASDLEVHFARPSANATVALNLWNTSAVAIDYVHGAASVVVAAGGHSYSMPVLATDETLSIRLLIDTNLGEAYFNGGRVALTFKTGTVGVPAFNVGITSTGSDVPAHAYEYMPGYDLPGADYSINNTFGADNNDPRTCEALCLADATTCKAWTFVAPGVQMPQARCCLKKSVPAPVARAGITSGAPGTGPMPGPSPAESVVLLNATSWEMSSIWTTAEQVLATPRADGRPL